MLSLVAASAALAPSASAYDRYVYPVKRPAPVIVKKVAPPVIVAPVTRKVTRSVVVAPHYVPAPVPVYSAAPRVYSAPKVVYPAVAQPYYAPAPTYYAPVPIRKPVIAPPPAKVAVGLKRKIKQEARLNAAYGYYR